MSASLIVTLITALANSVLNLLGAEGVVPANLSSLIGSIVAAGVSLFTALTSGASATSELQAVLSTLQVELTAIKNDTSADPKVISIIAEVDSLVSAAVTGFTNAQSGAVDPSTLDVPPAVQ